MTAQNAIKFGMDLEIARDYFIKAINLNARLAYFVKVLMRSENQTLKVNDSEFAEIIECSREGFAKDFWNGKKHLLFNY